jgi:hypothetical protein
VVVATADAVTEGCKVRVGAAGMVLLGTGLVGEGVASAGVVVKGASVQAASKNGRIRSGNTMIDRIKDFMRFSLPIIVFMHQIRMTETRLLRIKSSLSIKTPPAIKEGALITSISR